MPMKYAFGRPIAVTITGSVHGFLFVAFVIALFVAHVQHRFGLLTSAKLFVAAVIPFGFLYVERELGDHGPLATGGDAETG